MKITIRELAALAGVSRGTIDKVLHGRAGIRADVRARVQALIDAHGYHAPHQKVMPDDTQRVRTVAVLLPRGNPFFEQIRQGMERAAARLPAGRLVLEFFPCDSTSVTETLSLLSYLQARGVDGVLLRGLQSRRLRTQLDMLAAARIPAVLYDTDVPGAPRLCMVGEDGESSGRVAASLLAKSIGGTGEVAVIGGLADITVHQARLRGFSQVIVARYPQMHIVEVADSHDQSVMAYRETGRLLQQYPRLRGIFSVVGCTGDIGQALLDQRAGHVKLVGYHFTPDTVALVRRGIVDFAIGLMPHREGETALRVMADYLLEGHVPARDFIELPVHIGVDENIELLSQNELA